MVPTNPLQLIYSIEALKLVKKSPLQIISYKKAYILLTGWLFLSAEERGRILFRQLSNHAAIQKHNKNEINSIFYMTIESWRTYNCLFDRFIQSVKIRLAGLWRIFLSCWHRHITFQWIIIAIVNLIKVLAYYSECTWSQ